MYALLILLTLIGHVSVWVALVNRIHATAVHNRACKAVIALRSRVHAADPGLVRYAIPGAGNALCRSREAWGGSLAVWRALRRGLLDNGGPMDF